MRSRSSSRPILACTKFIRNSSSSTIPSLAIGSSVLVIKAAADTREKIIPSIFTYDSSEAGDKKGGEQPTYQCLNARQALYYSRCGFRVGSPLVYLAKLD